MKKIISILLTLVCVFSVCACGEKEKQESSSIKEVSSDISSEVSSEIFSEITSSVSEFEALKTETDKKANEAMASVVTENMTELQKLKITYEWLFWHFKYRAVALDLSNGYTDEVTYDLASYFFKYRKGSCEHYAAAQKVILNNLGYESMYVEGERLTLAGNWGEHVWLIVKYDGNWYHLDGLFSGNHTPSLTTVFLAPDSAIENTHKWDKTKYPVCTNPQPQL